MATEKMYQAVTKLPGKEVLEPLGEPKADKAGALKIMDDFMESVQSLGLGIGALVTTV